MRNFMSNFIFGATCGWVVAKAGTSIDDEPVRAVMFIVILVVAHEVSMYLRRRG